MSASQIVLLTIFYAELAASIAVFLLVAYRVKFVQADTTGSEEYFNRVTPVETTDASILMEDKALPFIENVS